MKEMRRQERERRQEEKRREEEEKKKQKERDKAERVRQKEEIRMTKEKEKREKAAAKAAAAASNEMNDIQPTNVPGKIYIKLFNLYIYNFANSVNFTTLAATRKKKKVNSKVFYFCLVLKNKTP